MSTNYPDFLELFDNLPDPRHHRTRRHNLVDVLFIALCTILTGGKTFTDMEDVAFAWEDWFKQFIPMTGGPPSHDTFNRVFQMIEPARFESCFIAWTQGLRKCLGTEIIAVDGKTNRGSKKNQQSPIHLVNAWACENRLVLGQLAVADKSNEITAVPELLKQLVLKNTVVTVDALNCQKDTAATIIEQGGDYVFALKGNQPRMHSEAALFLDELSEMIPAEVETLEKGHGRIELRKYWHTDDIAWFADLDQWPGLKSFGMVHSIRELSDGKSEEETRYYCSSLPHNSALFAKAVRAHWGVENMHWCLDVSFGEDQNRARTKYASMNLSSLRKMVLNMLHRETSSNKSLARKWRV